MTSALQLDFLWESLQRDGVTVSAQARQRLAHAFTLMPQLDEARLRALLACTLSKSLDERRVFEHAFQRWLRHAEWENAARQPVAPLEPIDPPPPGRKPKRWPWLWLGVVLVFVAVVVWWPRSAPSVPNPAPAPPPGKQEPAPPSPAPQIGFVATFPRWTPRVEPLASPFSLPDNLALSLVCIGLAAAIYRRYRRHGYRPKYSSQPRRGILQAPPLRVRDARVRLLSPAAVRGMVWNIDRFVSDELTVRVDLPRTVDATARGGGLIAIRHQPAVYPRTVWIWRDTAVTTEQATTLESEVAAHLASAGLPVRTAFFARRPTRVQWHDSTEVFEPRVMDGPGQSAMLVVLTDGRGMQAALQHDQMRAALDACLRSLSCWPHVAFADAAYGEHDLAATLRPYGLTCLAMRDVPRWLGGALGGLASAAPAPAAVAAPLEGELRVWAAALALAPNGFDEPAAQALHRALGLSVLPWELARVLRLTRPSGGGFTFSPADRGELVSWLVASQHIGWPVMATSWLARAVAFWQRALLVAGDEVRARAEPGSEVEGSNRLLAARRDGALVGLSVDPAGAALELEELADAHGMAADIRAHLAAHVARDTDTPTGGEEDAPSHGADAAVLRMPWRFSGEHQDIDDATRDRLFGLGFGGDRLRRVLVRVAPGRLVMAIAGLCTIALLGLTMWLLASPQRASDELTRFMPAEVRAAGGVAQSIARPDGAVVLAGLPHDLEVFPRQGDAGVEVRWQLAKDPWLNGVTLGGSVRFQRGALATRARPDLTDWPRRSLLVVEAANISDPARALVRRMLDAGGVDDAILGMDAIEQASARFVLGDALGGPQQDQIVILAPDAQAPPPEARALAAHFRHQAIVCGLPWDQLDAAGEPTPVARAWPIDARSFVQGEPRIVLPSAQPLPADWDAEILDPTPSPITGYPRRVRDKRTGIVFLLVEPGEFEMGSEKETDELFRDEKPVHTVRLTQPFYMAETETTQSQWRAVTGADKGRWKGDNLPVETVSWNDVAEFLAKLNTGHADGPFRLPTEAEWEYCCRAGTKTEFSFGDAISTDQANYDGNLTYGAGKKGVYRGKTTDVGSFPKNGWGFFDMHGNVWEWCADWYAAGYYTECGNPAVDPQGPTTGEFRVLRGGSWIFDPRSLRSADRSGVEPSDSVELIGFRCVRALRRQHR